MDFNNIWLLLLQNGASPKKEEGTRRYWLSLDDEKQQIAFNNISRKLAAQDFVHYDPIRAIKENSWQAKAPQPEWKRGDENEDLVQVRQNFCHIRPTSFSSQYRVNLGPFSRANEKSQPRNRKRIVSYETRQQNPPR